MLENFWTVLGEFWKICRKTYSNCREIAGNFWGNVKENFRVIIITSYSIKVARGLAFASSLFKEGCLGGFFFL